MKSLLQIYMYTETENMPHWSILIRYVELSVMKASKQKDVMYKKKKKKSHEQQRKREVLPKILTSHMHLLAWNTHSETFKWYGTNMAIIQPVLGI